MNANKDKDVKFLQVWVFPKEQNIEPRYEQKTFDPKDRQNKILTVVSPEDDNGVRINQDAWFSLGKLEKDREATYEVKRAGNGVYAFVLQGEVNINGQTLRKRDALGIWETDTLALRAQSDADFLLIDVPMEIKGGSSYA
jgi:hypothetical protein